MGPYLGLAVALALIWVAIAVKKTPKSHEVVAGDKDPELKFGPTAGRLFRNRSYAFGVAAQFFNVAAQVCVWTYIIIYVDEVVPGGDKIMGGFFLQASLIVFFIARFVMVWLMNYVRATKLLAILGGAAVLLCLYAAFVPGDLRRLGDRAGLLLPVADVPDHLRGVAAGSRSGHEVRRRVPGHGNRGWCHHAGRHGRGDRRHKRGGGVHRARGLLRVRGRLWALRLVEGSLGDDEDEPAIVMSGH